MNDLLKPILAIAGAIIGLAILATVVSKRSQTAQAIGAVSTSLEKIIAAAVSPASTAATNGNPALGSFSSPAGTSANSFGQILSSIMDTRADLSSIDAAMTGMGF